MNNGIVQFLAQSPMKVVVIDVELRVAVCKNDGSDKQRSGSAVAVLTFIPELPFQFVERYSAYTASMLANRAQVSQGKRKVPKLIPASLRRSCQKTWDGTVENGQQAKWIRRSSFSFKKQQTAWYHCAPWWLSHQRPFRVGLHCQIRCNHLPWRHWRWKLSRTCPLLDCSKRQWTTHATILTDSMSLQ